MAIEYLRADASPEKVFEILERDGCVVIENLLDRERIREIRDEMAPYMADAEKGGNEFDGFETRRVGMLVARSPHSHPVIMDPTVLGVAERALAHASNFQLHCTQIVSIGPGSVPQPIHRDQWAFDLFPFPPGFDTTFATMWAISDFREENGATRVIPGSHKMDDKLQFEQKDTEPAEMEPGSVLLYTGSLYHGGGENRSDADRVGLIVHYSLAWLRQEENQYISVPREVIDELPEDLLRMMGYAEGAFSLGFFDAGRDPIAAVRPEFEREAKVESLDEAKGKVS